MTSPAACSIPGCGKPVQKPSHKLCLEHWKSSRSSVAEPSSAYSNQAEITEPSNGSLTSTDLGKKFGLDPIQVNRILFDLKWIEKDGKGWTPSELGLKLKAERRVFSRNKVPFVLWPQDISKSRILQNAISELLAIETPKDMKAAAIPEEAADKPEGFRERFPATIRASDGHMVRSRAEALIDSWLYENRVVHAYEKLVRIEQKMYCDFYLPELDVYIEFWGLENDPRYRKRKDAKLDLYRKNDLRLIELRDAHIDNLDDHLTDALVRFGYREK